MSFCQVFFEKRMTITHKGSSVKDRICGARSLPRTRTFLPPFAQAQALGTASVPSLLTSDPARNEYFFLLGVLKETGSQLAEMLHRRAASWPITQFAVGLQACLPSVFSHETYVWADDNHQTGAKWRSSDVGREETKARPP